MTPNYPPTLLRGIPNKSIQFFDSQGQVTGNVFRPHDNQEPKNGYYEISINWEDDEKAEDFTLHEPLSDGSYHHKGGVARLSLERIDAMRKETPWVGAVEYCREPIANNNYHGNLLLSEDTVKNKNNKKALLARLRFVIINGVIPPIEQKKASD
jgi:hypothetical protein